MQFQKSSMIVTNGRTKYFGPVIDFSHEFQFPVPPSPIETPSVQRSQSPRLDTAAILNRSLQPKIRLYQPIFDHRMRVFEAASSTYMTRQRRSYTAVAENQAKLHRHEALKFAKQHSSLNPVRMMRDEQILESVAAVRFGVQYQITPLQSQFTHGSLASSESLVLAEIKAAG
jgi:hypothetical protein